jgi:hypothetical protein
VINASFIFKKALVHNDKAEFVVQSDASCTLNVLFVVRNATFLSQNASVIQSNAAFVLRKAPLIVDAAASIVQSDAFVDTNAALFVIKASFCNQEDAFVLIEASCVTERATLGSHEASPVETGVALAGAAAVSSEVSSARRPSPWSACEPDEAFEDCVVVLSPT